jgi:membrane-bound lytic murein transglycosylase B
VLSAGTRGSMHGEIGQTQFLPKNILAYGTGNLDVAANALSSTANFLRRGLPARRSQFRGHPGLERGSSLSARHRADRPPD